MSKIEKITKKQKNFILENIDVLDNYTLQDIVELLIDNMSKEYASELISEMIKQLNGEVKYLDMGDTYWWLNIN